MELIDRKYDEKTLILDCVGVRAIVLARILQELEEKAGLPIHKMFTKIIGISSGGVISLALSSPIFMIDKNGGKLIEPPINRYKTKDIVYFFLSKSEEIFNKTFTHTISDKIGLFNFLYDIENLESSMNYLFGDSLVSDSLCNVSVPIYSKKCLSTIYYQSCENKEPRFFNRDIACASMCTPFYFKHKKFYDNSERYYDIGSDSRIFLDIEKESLLKEMIDDSQKSRYTLYMSASPQNSDIILDKNNNIKNFISSLCSNNNINELSREYSKNKKRCIDRVYFKIPDNLDRIDDGNYSNMCKLIEKAELYISMNGKEIDSILENLRN